MNAMTKAHQIRKAAAEKFNCAVSEIHLGECLRLAHSEGSMETKKTVKWSTADGREVVYTAELILSEDINLDGDVVTVKNCEIEETITIAGQTVIGWWKNPTPPAKAIGAVKQYGMLAVKAEQYGLIQTALAEIKTHPAWVKNEENIEKNQAEIKEMEDSRTRNGYCKKCGSYCYGDCR